MRDRKSSNILPSFTIMHISLILLCAVLVSSHLIGGLYAAYVSNSEGGDGARVIYFGDISIVEDTENNNLMILPGVNGRKKASVVFEGSEAATYVFLRVKHSEHWEYDSTNHRFIINPQNREQAPIYITMDSKWTSWVHIENGTTAVFAMQLAPNVKLDTTTGSIFADDGEIVVSPLLNMTDINAIYDIGTKITISLDAIAVQSGGFANIDAAWSAVKTFGGE